MKTPPKTVVASAERALGVLSAACGALGTSGHGRALLRRLPVARLARTAVSRPVVRRQLDGSDDVTVLLGVRNRADHRIVNALKSIRDQEHPGGRVVARVVDYGSRPAEADRLARICRTFDAEHVRVDVDGPWSRSRCLNTGLRGVRTPFVLCSDVDILLSRRYVADAVRLLRERPLSVVCAPMLDLPEAATADLRAAASTERGLPLEEWKRDTTPRLGWDFHPSIALTWTAVLRLVRGYDEFYEVWGHEDVDLLRRLERLGLDPLVLDTGSFYLHQWHPKFESVPDEEVEERVRRNLEHLESHHSIVRNDERWGLER